MNISNEVAKKCSAFYFRINQSLKVFFSLTDSFEIYFDVVHNLILLGFDFGQGVHPKGVTINVSVYIQPNSGEHPFACDDTSCVTNLSGFSHLQPLFFVVLFCCSITVKDMCDDCDTVVLKVTLNFKKPKRNHYVTLCDRFFDV